MTCGRLFSFLLLCLFAYYTDTCTRIVGRGKNRSKHEVRKRDVTSYQYLFSILTVAAQLRGHPSYVHNQ